MSLICRKCAHWQPNSSVSFVENWQRLLRMQQINILPGRTQPDWSTGANNQYTHSRRQEGTMDPVILYCPRANDTIKANMDLYFSEGTEKVPPSQEQMPPLVADHHHHQQQRDNLHHIRSQSLPAFPLSQMTTSANCQDIDLGDDDTSMYLGGDEEERALFEGCTEPTVSVAIPKDSHVVLPPLRPSAFTAGSEEEAVAQDMTFPTQQQQHQQITYGNDAGSVASPRLHDWLDQNADPASIPMAPPSHHYPAFFSPYYYNHVLDRLPVDSIPPNRPKTDPRKLIWGRSPLARVTLPEELVLTNLDGFGTGISG